MNMGIESEMNPAEAEAMVVHKAKMERQRLIDAKVAGIRKNAGETRFQKDSRSDADVRAQAEREVDAGVEATHEDYADVEKREAETASEATSEELLAIMLKLAPEVDQNFTDNRKVKVRHSLEWLRTRMKEVEFDGGFGADTEFIQNADISIGDVERYLQLLEYRNEYIQRDFDIRDAGGWEPLSRSKEDYLDLTTNGEFHDSEDLDDAFNTQRELLSNKLRTKTI